MTTPELTLRIRWAGPHPARSPGYARAHSDSGFALAEAPPTEFGLQSGRADILPPLFETEEELVFETAVMAYIDAAGRQRFRGPCVQGTADEPFLYLSWRVQGASQWLMRGKAELAPLTAAAIADVPPGAVFETVVMQLGHRPRIHVQVWSVVNDPAGG